MKIAALAASLLLASPAAAEDIVIYHQGMLLGESDAPLTGAVDLTLTLYDQAEPDPAHAVWNATYAVTPFRGAYSIALGADKDKSDLRKKLDAADVAGPRWLEVKVGDTRLSPALAIGAVPVALRANSAAAALDAEKLGGIAASQYALKSYVDAEVAAVAPVGYARLDGAVFTGPVSVPAPAADAHAATRKYVDDEIAAAAPAGYARLDGATFTGAVSVPAPIADAHAATRKYVDDKAAGYLPLGGGTLTGALTLAGAPGGPGEAATRAYVDAVDTKLAGYLPLSGGTLAGPLKLAAVGADCDSNLAGAVQYSAGLFLGCSGVAWEPLNPALRFQDLVATYEYNGNNTPQYGGDASIWNDECLEGGDILHFGDVGNALGTNWILFTMKVPVNVYSFYAKTRTHTGGNYFGNAKLSGSNNKTSWFDLATLGGSDGVCIDKGPVQVKSNTRFKYYRIDLWGNGRSTYESLSHFKIEL